VYTFFCGYSFYTFNIILLICHQRPMTFGLNKRTNIQSISVFIMINPANRNTVHEVLHRRVSAATHLTQMRNFHSKSRISKSTKHTKKVDAKAGLGVMNIISVAIMFDHHKKLISLIFFRRKLSKLDIDLHFCIMTSVWDFSNPPFYWMIS